MSTRNSNNNSSRKTNKLKLALLTIETIGILILFSNQFYAQKKEAAQNDNVFGVAFLKSMYLNINYNDAFAAIKVYVSELQRQLLSGYEMKPIMYNDAKDLVDNFYKENLADITLNPVDFQKYRSKLPIYPVLVSSGLNGPLEKYLILVRKDDGIKQLSDLKDKKLGTLQNEMNPIPDMWLEVIIGSNRLPNKSKLFKYMTFGKTEAQLILSLFFKQLDVCVVSESAFETMSELNPQIKNQIQILQSSPGYPMAVSAFTDKFKDSKFSSNLFNILIKLNTYSKGKQLFALTKTVKIVPYKEEYMDSLKKLIRDYNKLRSN